MLSEVGTLATKKGKTVRRDRGDSIIVNWGIYGEAGKKGKTCPLRENRNPHTLERNRGEF